MLVLVCNVLVIVALMTLTKSQSQNINQRSSKGMTCGKTNELIIIL